MMVDEFDTKTLTLVSLALEVCKVEERQFTCRWEPDLNRWHLNATRYLPSKAYAGSLERERFKQSSWKFGFGPTLHEALIVLLNELGFVIPEDLL